MQTHTRRTFLTGATSLALVPFITLPEEGCSVSQATLATLAGILGEDGAQLAIIEGNPALAAQITKETAIVQADITNWVAGSPTADIIEAIGVFEGLLNTLPITSQNLALINLLLGTLQAVLALLPASKANTSFVAAVTVSAQGHAKTKLKVPVAQDLGLKGFPVTPTTFNREFHTRVLAAGPKYRSLAP